jgi:CelD/BcsL family acetyltransferase involved in cellulose biosynthesis
MLTTQLITSDEQLAALKTPWNKLAAGEPMHSWTWLANWWKHYGSAAGDDDAGPSDLRVVAVYDETAADPKHLIGVAPWYLEHSLVKGNVLLPLGSGEVCTDHLSLICRPEDAETVATAVAEHLTEDCDDWDCLELPAVDVGDAAIEHLVERLESRECLVASRVTGNTWQAVLPDAWDTYEQSLTANNRRSIRRLQKKVIATSRTERHVVTCGEDFEPIWKVFVDLHQRRRKSLGEPGCFASKVFHDFHHEVAQELLATGQLRMSWVDIDGSPAVAEYQYVGPTTNYSYQSGVDPDRMDLSPGHVGNFFAIQRAISEGCCSFDFLRGDEFYKTFWNAKPKPICDWCVFSNRRLARLRGRLRNAATTLKDWVREGVELVTN